MEPPNGHPPSKSKEPDLRLQLNRTLDTNAVVKIAWTYFYQQFGSYIPSFNSLIGIIRYPYDCISDGDHEWKKVKYSYLLMEFYTNIPKDIHNLNSFQDDKLRPLQIRIKQILFILYKKLDEFEGGPREKYHKIIDSLREALLSKEYEQARHTNSVDVQQLHQVAAALYNSKLYSFADSVIIRIIQIGHEINSGLKAEMIDVDALSLEEQQAAIYQCPQSYKAPIFALSANKVKGALGYGFDPLIMGNPPFVLFDLKILGHETRFLRTGTPTIGLSDTEIEESQAIMSPEFQAYLRHSHDTGNKVLYFNLQCSTEDVVKPKIEARAEISRTEALKRGFERVGMADNFFTIDHDSRFYHQSKEWKRLYDSEKFKEEIINQFFNTPVNHCPELVKKDLNFRKEMIQLINHIHHDVFFNESRLDRQKRRDFLDIFYSLFIFLCQRYYKPNTIIVVCKDAVDRSGKTIFLLLELMKIFRNDTSIESSHIQTVVTLAPTILAKKQEMHQSRFKRMLRNRDRLSVPEVKANLYSRSQQEGYDQEIEIITHPSERQNFKID